MDKIALYTCIVGGYDRLMQPADPDPGFDHICFVGADEPAGRDGVWELRPLPFSTGSAVLDSRYPKMHPHELLPEYECSLWVDGNILIKDRTLYDAARAAEVGGSLYAGVSHPSRDCVYDEAVKCRDMRYFGYIKLAHVLIRLRANGIRRHAGLLENNIIFRRHNAPEIVRLDAMWWNELLHFCRRDQLSLGLCMKKCEIIPALLLPGGVSSRNCPGLEYRLHSSRSEKGAGTL